MEKKGYLGFDLDDFIMSQIQGMKFKELVFVYWLLVLFGQVIVILFFFFYGWDAYFVLLYIGIILVKRLF